jgi:hypothetical protein
VTAPGQLIQEVNVENGRADEAAVRGHRGEQARRFVVSCYRERQEQPGTALNDAGGCKSTHLGHVLIVAIARLDVALRLLPVG